MCCICYWALTEETVKLLENICLPQEVNSKCSRWKSALQMSDSVAKLSKVPMSLGRFLVSWCNMGLNVFLLQIPNLSRHALRIV